MKSLSTPHIFTKGLLLVAGVFSIAATGLFASSAILGQQYPSLAFAQEELGTTDTTDTEATTTTTTTTDNATEGTTTTTGATTAAETAPNASKMMGVIASIQLDENGNPAWVTSGHWNLESDAPLIGAEIETEPQVSNFSATLYMVSNADGTALHPHEVSDFVQTAVLHEGPNATTVNGTFTITLEQGTVENVNGYISI